jgi:hypothetical protein
MLSKVRNILIVRPLNVIKFVVMRLFVTVCFLLFGEYYSIGQTVDPRIDDKEGFMRQVFELEGYSMTQIHDATELWIKKNYVKPTEVLAVNDSNYVRVREHVDLPNIDASVVDCNAVTEWDIKDGRVRITISQYECTSKYSDFNALVSMRKNNGDVKMGYSAHLKWVIDSFNNKARGLNETLKGEVKQDDW